MTAIDRPGIRACCIRSGTARFNSAAGKHLVTAAVCLFALSTAISWSYYGDRCVEYFVSSKIAVFVYRIIFCVCLFLGAIWKLTVVWAIADMAITLMAVPNLIALIALASLTKREYNDYFKRMQEMRDRGQLQ